LLWLITQFFCDCKLLTIFIEQHEIMFFTIVISKHYKEMWSNPLHILLNFEWTLTNLRWWNCQTLNEWGLTTMNKWIQSYILIHLVCQFVTGLGKGRVGHGLGTVTGGTRHMGLGTSMVTGRIGHGRVGHGRVGSERHRYPLIIFNSLSYLLIHG